MMLLLALAVVILGAESILPDVPITVNIYVSPKGSDGNSGFYPNQPLKTIQAAVDIIPKLKSQCNSTDILHDVIIELMRGYHQLQSTLKIKNTENRQITIRPYQEEDVYVFGGKIIPTSSFHKVQDSAILNRLPQESRNHVLQVNLADVGITDYGNLREFGFKRFSNKDYIELFENGDPFKLARYPNEGYINVVNILSDGKSFKYDSDRPKRWVGERHVWCHGFWYWNWADIAANVTSLIPDHQIATLGFRPHYGIREGHYDFANPTAAGYKKQGGNFIFFNVLSELDEPGEYFVDVDLGVLYFYPIKAAPFTDSDVIYASVINDCVEIGDNSRNIKIEGITLEACRKYGVTANGVNNIILSKMQIRNTGNYAVRVTGNNVKINRCNIKNTDGGIYINGGDRATLTPSGNEISDSMIGKFGRSAYVGSYGVIIEGVGCHYHHNIMYKGSYTGIRWTGNDHIIEYSHFSDMCSQASDCGALMSGRSFDWRGVKIRYNHILNTKRRTPGADCRGVMLDDQLSGVEISNNVFYQNDVHCNIGGGRDNIIKQNVMSQAYLYSIDMDNRGIKGGSHTQWMINNMKRLPYTSIDWNAKYPELVSLTDGTSYPSQPEGNVITENIFQSDAQHITKNYGSNWFNITDNFYVTEDSNFYAPEYGDFTPRCLLDEFVIETHFKTPLSASQVGPRETVGPKQQNIVVPSLGYKTGTPPIPKPCAMSPPRSPKGYTHLPDGTKPNTLYNIPSSTVACPTIKYVVKQDITTNGGKGCWYAIKKCTNEPDLEQSKRSDDNQFIRDTNDESAKSEEACFNQVPTMVARCGGNSYFAVIFAPTGATTLGGDGCFIDRTGCPSRNLGPRLSRDTWAELHVDGANNEGNCLGRALPFWRWCGSYPNFPVTSIFGGTGKKRIIGGGCYIRPEKCATNLTLSPLFYDGEGGANYATDSSPRSCMKRAQHFWELCGSDDSNKVTAYFRPLGWFQTFP